MTIRIPKWTLAGAAILLVAAAAFFIGRASVNDESDSEGSARGAGPDVATEAKPEATTSTTEFSGPCGESAEGLGPKQPGFSDLVVIDASCAYGSQVAQAFIDQWPGSCADGCRVIVESIPCTYEPEAQTVICAAARTGVEFRLAFPD